MSSRHSAAIADFLEISRGSIPKDYEVKWYSKIPVQAIVAQQVVGKVPMQYKMDVKRKALDDVMAEVRSTLKDVRKGGFDAAPWLKYGRYDKQRDALVDQMVDDIKERLRGDAGVTAEMLYNNRVNVIKAVTAEVQQQKKAVEGFLNKSENKGKDLSVLKVRWRTEGQKVTDTMSKVLSDKFKENIAVSAEMEKELSVLRSDMMQCARDRVTAIEKEDKMQWTSPEYYVERDTMVQAMIDSTIDLFDKKNRLSEGFLRINHRKIVTVFEEGIEQNSQAIEARMHDMVEQTKSSSVPFLLSGRRAQRVLDERGGEAKDLDVVQDITSRFGDSVEELCKVERVKERAKSVAAGLKSAREAEAVHAAAKKVEEKRTR